MQFEPSPEVQETLQSLDRLLERDWADLAPAEDTSLKQRWSDLANLGVLGICIPQTYGGFGLSADSSVHVSATIGRRLCHLPYISTAVCCAAAICAGATEQQKHEWLPPLAEGRHLWAIAYLEDSNEYDIFNCNTRATPKGEEWTLHGNKILVMDGVHADFFLVSARTHSSDPPDSNSSEELALFIVAKDTAGLSIRNYRTIDNRVASTLSLDGVTVKKLSRLGGSNAGHALTMALSAGCTALAGEAVGLMERLLSLTTDYLKTRKQFGQPLGKFQVMQHAAADMNVALEQMKSLSLYAAHLQDTEQAEQAAGAAKIYAGTSGRRFAKKAIQLHGGMGMVNEMPAAHYAKRLAMLDCWLGDSSYHLNRRMNCQSTT